MKKLITSAFLLAALTACSENDAVLENQTTPEKITVSLGIKGEIETSAGPLTRSPEFEDLWGIQVYALSGENDEHEVPYAYALVGDNYEVETLENLTLDLYPGTKYRFEVTMIDDGDQIVRRGTYETSSGDKATGYSRPFNLYEKIDDKTYKSRALDVTSGFVNSDKQFLYGLSNEVDTNKGEQDYLFIQRYYTKEDINCTAEMAYVELTMKKAFCGIKCMAEGLTEGELKFQINNVAEMSLTSSMSKKETTEFVSATDFIKIINGTPKYEFVALSINILYINANGISRVLDTVDIQAHRNMLYTINVKLSGECNNANNVGTRMLIESTEMTEEETITVENKNGSYSHS